MTSPICFNSSTTRGGEPVRVLLNPNKNKGDKLLVVCHGLGGKCTRSWRNLLTLYKDAITCPNHPLAEYDIVFIGFHRSPPTIELVGRFVETRIRAVYPKLRHHDHPRQYSELHIAGHSLGALACRRAFNQLVMSGLGGKIDLTSFSPPYCGGFHSGIEGESKDHGGWIGKFSSFITIVLYRLKPILRELDYKHSPAALMALRYESNRLFASPNVYYPDTRLVLATNDNVIHIPSDLNDFVYSSDVVEDRETGHTQVIKSRWLSDLDWTRPIGSEPLSNTAGEVS